MRRRPILLREDCAAVGRRAPDLSSPVPKSFAMLSPLLLSAALLAATPEARPTNDVEATAQAALARLPGHTAFIFSQIDGNQPRALYAVRADERFAVGSSFKLFILGTLADEVNADRRGLDNVMLLERDLAGPPHSELASWPSGSPVTLHTLALKMITISDNTATDHLLYLLDRRRVEQQMQRMGHEHPEWNVPLLSTREMAGLRDRKARLPGRDYQKLDEAGRRAFLAERFGGPPDYDQLDFDTAAYELAEWYATPADMARAMTWLKNNTNPDEPAHPLRAILAVDPKLPHDPVEWPYVGFKGGSEDQLLAGNWLLQNKSGRWYTLHVFWNRPDGKADAAQLVTAVGTIFAAIQRALR
jgi:beta-lactamase class A